MLFLSCFCYAFIDAMWSPAGKGLTSWLSFVMSNCEVGILGQVWCLIVLIPDFALFLTLLLSFSVCTYEVPLPKIGPLFDSLVFGTVHLQL